MTLTQIRSKKETPALTAVSKRAGKALVEFDMIREGDRIAVAVSGGKDSLSLLHVLRDRLRISPVKFDFTAVHIDFEFSDFNPQILIDYLEKEGFPCLVEKADSLKDERYEDIDCFRWSWNRRKALFQLADREGFNKIAFGHHMDDIVETILLNQFYRGEIAAMKPKQELFDGKLTIIRPLAYVREEAMVRLAHELGIAGMGQSKCANDDTSHRMLIKKMLRQFELENPMIVANIFNSLQNIKSEYLIETIKSQSHHVTKSPTSVTL
ncbi:MAG: tRNA 2-thiocytidine(32) synthetase TtcA [Candidatus Omnitrophica bacterium]|nr:tRNA 2-thiocytidine(32) synthetase TtcA [Candidatus Omnitrophota bacterium]